MAVVEKQKEGESGEEVAKIKKHSGGILDLRLVSVRWNNSRTENENKNFKERSKSFSQQNL